MDLPISTPSFTVQRSSMKHVVEWKCLTLILSEEIREDMYCSSYKYKKNCPKLSRVDSYWDTNGLFHCHISNIKIANLS